MGEMYKASPRLEHKNAPNGLLNYSVDKIIAFTAFDRIDTLLTQPLLMIAGSDAGSRWQNERAIKLATTQKELFIVDGGTHMSLYDKDVMKAIPKITEFFGKNLE